MGNKYIYCTVQALSAQFNEPEEGKNPSVEVRLKVVSCQDQTRVGQEFTEYLSLSGGAVRYTMASLRALGWTCNDVTELDGVGGLSAQGGIYLDTYKGVSRDKLTVFSAKAKVAGAAKKSFAAQFKAEAASAAKVEATPANAPVELSQLPEQQPATDDDADLPF